MALGNGAHRIHAGKGAWFVDHRKVEIGTPRTIGTLAVGAEFAAQQATGQGAPDHQADLLVG